MNKPLLSFHGKQEIKDAHMAQLLLHYQHDEIIQGTYWQNGKGCDTGCSLHSGDHRQWEIQLGIPMEIGYIRDKIFEWLPNHKAKEFPMACSAATPVGVNLDSVWKKFMVYWLLDNEVGLIHLITNEKVKASVQAIADALTLSLTTPIPHEKQLELIKAFIDALKAYLAYLAYLADLAYRAYLAYLADLAYRADRADLADLAEKFSNKLIALLMENHI